MLVRSHAANECPLWVMRRHLVTSASCPLFPSKRTFVIALSMSAFVADMLASVAGVDAAVRLAPMTCRSENSELVDLHRRRPAQHLPGDIARHAALARGRGVLVDG